MGCSQSGTVFQILMLVGTIHFSCGVAASPSDRLWTELESIKTKLTHVLEEQSTLRTLYTLKIEPHIVSVANVIGSLDSNVKNIQERAHVWDTFQHHVSAWNEQIRIIDNKLTILSRGQEKVDSLLEDIHSLFNLEYKTNFILTKIEDNSNKLENLTKLMKDNEKEKHLVEEFAALGVLSTLKSIEQKVDHLNTVFQSDTKIKGNNKSGNNRRNESNEEVTRNRQKFVIRCQFPRLLEETLQDISAKIDIIFDKMGHSICDSEFDHKVILRNKTIISLNDRSKEAFTGLSEDNLLKKFLIKVTNSQNTTLDAFKKFMMNYTQNFTDNLYKMESYCKDALLIKKNISDDKQNMLSRLDKVELLIKNHNVCYTDNLKSFLTQERAHLESFFLHRLSLNNNNNSITSYTNKSEMYTYGCDNLKTNVSKVYQLGPKELNNVGRDFHQRYCDYGNEDIGWTVIQRRGPYSNIRENFNRTWEDYRNGFGSLEGEFWFGNDYIHRLTTEQDVVLHVTLEDFEGNQAWAQYSTFRVLQESDAYRLEVGGYSGNASDSLLAHNNFQFSTIDRNNDIAPPCCPCAPAYGGGWWFYSCFESNLNGIYQEEPTQNDYFQGIIWENWRGNYSLKKAIMKIKPKPAVTTHNSEVDDTTLPFMYEDP